MNGEGTTGLGRARADGRSPADRSIVLMGCIGAAFTLAIVTLVSLAGGVATIWLLLGPMGTLLFAAIAYRAWRQVARHGYFHDASDEEEDEDGNPPGGSGVRYPPDAPDGGGSLEFDWDAFLSGFRDHVEATARDSRSEPSLQ